MQGCDCHGHRDPVVGGRRDRPHGAAEAIHRRSTVNISSSTRNRAPNRRRLSAIAVSRSLSLWIRLPSPVKRDPGRRQAATAARAGKASGQSARSAFKGEPAGPMTWSLSRRTSNLTPASSKKSSTTRSPCRLCTLSAATSMLPPASAAAASGNAAADQSPSTRQSVRRSGLPATLQLMKSALCSTWAPNPRSTSAVSPRYGADGRASSTESSRPLVNSGATRSRAVTN